MDAPVFVKISEYNKLSGILDKIRERLDATSKTINEIEKLKEEEDKQLDEWKEHLSLVEEKLKGVGEALHKQ